MMQSMLSRVSQGITKIKCCVDIVIDPLLIKCVCVFVSKGGEGILLITQIALDAKLSYKHRTLIGEGKKRKGEHQIGVTFNIIE